MWGYFSDVLRGLQIPSGYLRSSLLTSRRAGSRPWRSFPQHLPLTSACSISTLPKALEYTQDHLLAPWQPFSWLLRAAPGTQTIWVLVSVPLKLYILCIVEALQQGWKACSILYTMLSEDKSLFLGCDFRRNGDLWWRSWRVLAELKLFSWSPSSWWFIQPCGLMETAWLFFDVANSGAWCLSYTNITRFKSL